MKPIINNLKITSPYGDRRDPADPHKRQFHDGIDFKCGLNPPDRRVFSIGAGQCVFDFDDYEDKKRWTDPKHSGGNYTITLEKIDGVEYYVKYLHLVENYLSKGQFFDAGFCIGKYADVGYSFGAHLHLNMYDKNWRVIDPTPVLKKIKMI